MEENPIMCGLIFGETSNEISTNMAGLDMEIIRNHQNCAMTSPGRHVMSNPLLIHSPITQCTSKTILVDINGLMYV